MRKWHMYTVLNSRPLAPLAPLASFYYEMGRPPSLYYHGMEYGTGTVRTDSKNDTFCVRLCFDCYFVGSILLPDVAAAPSCSVWRFDHERFRYRAAHFSAQ